MKSAKNKTKIVMLGLLAVSSFSVGAFFWLAFYFRYWKWHEEIDQAKSSYITPEGDNLTMGGIFWAFPAISLTIAGLVLLLVLLIQSRKPNHVIYPTRCARGS